MPRVELDRREFLTLGMGLFVAASLPLALRRRVVLVRRTLPLMGTLAELQVAHRDERTAEAAIDAAFAELQWVERTMSRFRSESDLGRANRGAAREAVAITPETALVLREALAWSVASDGAFDPGLGAASELWDVLNRTAPPPTPPVRRLAGRGFWRQVDLGSWRGQPAVRLGAPDLHLDLGAIAKGYAIDRATGVLRERGIRNALVTVGGDLYALGSSPDGGAWRVGIRDPDDRRALRSVLQVSDRAVATSGDYERYFAWRGVRYHHLLDPATAAPRRTRLHSVTVLGDACMDADAAATATFGLEHAAALRVVRARIPGGDVIPLA